MQIIKLFLASSEELKDDRGQFELFIARQNQKYVKEHIFFDLIIWENFLDAVSQTRLQDEYNKKVANCDIFVSLFKTKVGAYTEEEFDTALKVFKAKGRPFIYTYFKDVTVRVNSNNRKEMQSLWAFQDKLSDLGHFYTIFESTADLKNKFREQLDKLLPLIKTEVKDDTFVKVSNFDKGINTQIPTTKNFIQEVNAVDIELIYVKGGKFRMGTKDWEHTQPIRPRRIADFYIGKYPVTIEEYMDFVRETKSNYPEWHEKGSKYNLKTGSDKHYEGFTDNLSQPIVGVSWHNAVAYCKWLSKKTGKTFRLLSEAEWEYAAGGGSQNRTKYAGTNNEKELGDYAWYWKNSGNKNLDGNWDKDKILANKCKTHPVGQKKPNQLGIHAMSGNVWEWCQDTWSTNYEDALTSGKAYKGGDTNLRVLRGGSWGNGSSGCRVALRDHNIPAYRGNGYGFRVASSSPNVS